MLGFLRRKSPRRAIPDALWAATLARYPFLLLADAAEAARLRELAEQFLAAKQFHGAGGLAIDDTIAVAIAAQAVLPILHLGLHWYDDFVVVVVHPDEVVARRRITDEDGIEHQYDEVLAGEAMERGPVMVNWRDVAAAGSTAAAGYNVVIHEFAHKIDARDGVSDGCPPLASSAARREWLAVMKAEYEAFREKVIVAQRFSGEAPWLDDYGATAIDEFFAVACEAYFVNRVRFAQELPRLLPLFDGFFRVRSGA